MKKQFLLLTACWLIALHAYTQNVAINEDGSLPNPHAIVDIKSSTKGILIPRMSTAARLSIPNVQGLLVFDITTNSVWYNTGIQWQDLGNSLTNSWLLKGNGNTVDKINFIGTTNDVPLNFRVNNQTAGRIDDARWNTYWGYLAGQADSTGMNNTANGTYSLQSNKTGDDNTAIGFKSLFQNTQGQFNTAIGATSLENNVVGSDNTATGFFALFSNISGNGNVAYGSNALVSNSSGVYNSAIGFNSLRNNITGSANVAAGLDALHSNTGGNVNVAVGEQALFQNTIGTYNIAIGTNALYSNISGFNDIAIGNGADANGPGLNNAIAIGNGAIVNASNKVRIGNTDITVIEGQVHFTTPSDGRFKFNIQENVKGLDFILKLRPVTYQFDVNKQENFINGIIKPDQLNSQASVVANNEATQMIRTGFIAQEVEQAAKKAGYNFDGIKIPKSEKEYYSLSYSSFVVPLVKAVQEQQEIIGSQNKKMEEQERRISDLEKQIADIKKLLVASH